MPPCIAYTYIATYVWLQPRCSYKYIKWSGHFNGNQFLYTLFIDSTQNHQSIQQSYGYIGHQLAGWFSDIIICLMLVYTLSHLAIYVFISAYPIEYILSADHELGEYLLMMLLVCTSCMLDSQL